MRACLFVLLPTWEVTVQNFASAAWKFLRRQATLRLLRDRARINAQAWQLLHGPAGDSGERNVEFELLENRTLRVAGTSNDEIRTTVAALRQRLLDSIPDTPLSVLIDHIDHIAKVAGVDHVGIGSDFDGVTALPIGMEDVTRLPHIAQALLDRGYTDDDIKKIIGGNLLRVLETAIDPTERKR